jgi:hypothetical protein
MGEILDKIKDKAKDVKDSVVDTTKDVTGKENDSVDNAERTTVDSNDKQYEEGVAGTNKHRQSDPLTEFSDEEPMTPAKLNAGEPTAVKRDPSDQKITSEGQTGTNTDTAAEEYRKRGMTKVESDSSNTM